LSARRGEEEIACLLQSGWKRRRRRREKEGRGGMMVKNVEVSGRESNFCLRYVHRDKTGGLMMRSHQDCFSGDAEGGFGRKGLEGLRGLTMTLDTWNWTRV